MPTSPASLLTLALFAGFLAWAGCSAGDAAMPRDQDAASPRDQDAAARQEQEATSRPAKKGLARTPVPKGPGPLFVVTGNEQGHIRPCGCSKPALGGVHRRATVIGRLREKEADLIAVSGGDLVVQGGLLQRLKFETFLTTLSMMGYRAFAPGAGEFALGVEYLQQAKELAEFPFTSLNVTRDGRPLFERFVRFEGTPFVMTGLIPALDETVQVTVEDPAKALMSLLAELGETDQLLVFFHGKRKLLAPLAKQVPESWRPRITWLRPSIEDATDLGEPLAGSRVVKLGSKGRFLGMLRPGGDKPVAAWRLEEEIELEEMVASVLDAYREAIKEEKLVENWPRRPNDIAFVGAAACIECHEDSCKALADTPHERAFPTLERTNDQFDPECVSCHVVGWGIQGGYVSPEKTPQLKNVTCEACHGPGEDHVESMAPTPNGKLGEKFCITCHDPDNSPGFTFEKYWPKILHPTEDK